MKISVKFRNQEKQESDNKNVVPQQEKKHNAKWIRWKKRFAKALLRLIWVILGVIAKFLIERWFK
jgi:hypothetical protein